MTEADPEHRHPRAEFADQLRTDTGVFWTARSRRDADMMRCQRFDFIDTQPPRRVEAMVGSDAIGRHAVWTAEIARIDDRHAQVAQRTTQPIERQPCWLGLRVALQPRMREQGHAWSIGSACGSASAMQAPGSATR